MAADSELARLLDASGGKPLVPVLDGARYRVEREPAETESVQTLADPTGIWADYDPERVRRALAETAGSWRTIGTEALIAALYAARRLTSGWTADLRPLRP